MLEQILVWKDPSNYKDIYIYIRILSKWCISWRRTPRSWAHWDTCKYQMYYDIWVCLKMLCTPKNPMVLLIIIPFSNGYFIGGIPHFQTYPYHPISLHCVANLSGDGCRSKRAFSYWLLAPWTSLGAGVWSKHGRGHNGISWDISKKSWVGVFNI